MDISQGVQYILFSVFLCILFSIYIINSFVTIFPFGSNSDIFKVAKLSV